MLFPCLTGCCSGLHTAPYCAKTRLMSRTVEPPARPWRRVSKLPGFRYSISNFREQLPLEIRCDESHAIKRPRKSSSDSKSSSICPKCTLVAANSRCVPNSSYSFRDGQVNTLSQLSGARISASRLPHSSPARIFRKECPLDLWASAGSPQSRHSSPYRNFVLPAPRIYCGVVCRLLDRPASSQRMRSGT